MTVSEMHIPIFRKILSILFTEGPLRSTELLEKMSEEGSSRFYNAMKKLEGEELIMPTVKLKKLVIYNLTDKGTKAVKEYIKKSNHPREIINVIYQSRNYDDLFYKILILDVKKRIGIEGDIIENGDGVYKDLVKKNYDLFIKKMREDLEYLNRELI